MHKKASFVIIVCVLALLSGCATTQKTGRWVVSGVKSVAYAPNTVVVINNRTDMLLEVRINGTPVMAKNEKGEQQIAYITPRGSVSQGFSTFTRYYDVSLTVVGHCLPDAPKECISGRMTDRHFYVEADGTRQRVDTWNIDASMLR